VAGCCEDGDEPSGSIKGGEFLRLSGCWLFKRDSAPWSELIIPSQLIISACSVCSL
jgi:hypothetical protein